MEIKLIEAMVISGILAILIFRINYASNPKISRAKYTRTNDKTKYNYLLLLIDLAVAILFALIGCYLAWNSISTIPKLYDYLDYIFPASIMTGITFQQGLPILIELVMDKLNTIRPINNRRNSNGK